MTIKPNNCDYIFTRKIKNALSEHFEDECVHHKIKKPSTITSVSSSVTSPLPISSQVLYPQVACVCEVLEQSGSVDRLAR